MKKIIFLLAVVVCAFAACDPTHEDISNAGHITPDELKAKTTVTVDKAASGQNGNVISCQTLAPVNAKWKIGDKEFIGNYATKKMKLGEHKVILTALCPDGTLLKDSFMMKCQEITDPLQRFWIYGEDPEKQPPFQPGAWDAAAMRFSDYEGKYLRYLTDDEYWGFKTLVMDVQEASADCAMRIMNGWWSATYADGVPVVAGTNEIQLTEAIAKDCARGNGGSGKDLQLMITSGSCTVNSIYYEE
ncbi:MAG: hypothetical protein IJK46_06845 [Prevotella sp.]|nr:hypothetical protein [Prevotella sp.]